MKLASGKKVTFGKAILSRVGQSLVEFALVAPLFFLLVFGITDFGRLFFTQETLQYAVREAGRFAVTGRHLTTSGGADIDRVTSIKQIAQKAAVGLITDINTIQVMSGGVTNSAGGPRETVLVSLTTKLVFITPFIGKFFPPDGAYTFTVSTTFMNEPFSGP
jgi:Flp pilus assembly protein TadG